MESYIIICFLRMGAGNRGSLKEKSLGKKIKTIDKLICFNINYI
jgi:hypothetical protein